ncbi:conserved hypothetical protein [Mesorhizobium sp. ORS 3324]|nr:conserved hypothetical protein [Mesorhizobium sp. ORS 3324]
MGKKKSRPIASAMETASPSEVSEAVYFARRCGLTPDEALRIMRKAQAAPDHNISWHRKRKR